MSIEKLKAELFGANAATYAPLTDAEVADLLNTVNIPTTEANNISRIYGYIFNKNHRTNQGSDTQYVPIIGRLVMVAESVLGSDPFGRGAGNEINLIQKTSCLALLELLRSPNSPSIDLTDSNFPLGSVNGAGVISTAHKNDIEALSQATISRAHELGIQVREGDVTTARIV